MNKLTISFALILATLLEHRTWNDVVTLYRCITCVLSSLNKRILYCVRITTSGTYDTSSRRPARLWCAKLQPASLPLQVTLRHLRWEVVMCGVNMRYSIPSIPSLCRQDHDMQRSHSFQMSCVSWKCWLNSNQASFATNCSIDSELRTRSTVVYRYYYEPWSVYVQKLSIQQV